MIKLIASDVDGTLLPEGTADLNPELYDVILKLKEKGIFVGIVTIMGNVVPETHYAPEKIAEVYWKMYQERKVWEYIYQ